MRRAALALPLLVSCCAQPTTCPAPLAPMFVWNLFFGGDVGAADWAGFAHDSIEPAFPEGITVLDAAGFWQGGHEGSRVLVLAAPDNLDTDRRVAALAAAYRARFAQDSVGMVRVPGCGRF